MAVRDIQQPFMHEKNDRLTVLCGQRKSGAPVGLSVGTGLRGSNQTYEIVIPFFRCSKHSKILLAISSGEIDEVSTIRS